MKNLAYIFFMLFSIVTFSQEKKETTKTKDIDKKVNISLDSLSKVYKKDVRFYAVEEGFGRRIETIKYYDKKKNLKSQIISNTPID
jgi:hypothetical protein